MDNNDTRRRTTTNTEDAVRSTAYAHLLKLVQGPADYWDRPAGDWGPKPAVVPGRPAETRADANSAYRLATKALRRHELDAARAGFTLALTEQHPGAAFRIVLTEPRRSPHSLVFIPTGGGKTHVLIWMVKHLMAAARWGHADAVRLLAGIQTARPLRSLERVLADMQHPASAGAENLWSGLAFTCPPLTYEAQDTEFYPAVRDVLAHLLKAPAAAPQAGPSSRARALPAACSPLVLPPVSSVRSHKLLDTFRASKSEAAETAIEPASQETLALAAGNNKLARLTLFTGQSSSGKTALLSALRQFDRGSAQPLGDFGEERAERLFLRKAEADSVWEVFRVVDDVMPVVRDVSVSRYPEEEAYRESLARHVVILMSGHSEAAAVSRASPAYTCVAMDVAAAMWAWYARSAPRLWDPFVGCVRALPASAWMVAVTGDDNVGVWDPGSGLLIGSSTSEAHTPSKRLVPPNTDLGSLAVHGQTAAVLLKCTADTVDEVEWLNAVVLRGLYPSEREVVLAYTAVPGRRWEEAAAVVGVRDPAAVGEQVRRKVKRLAAAQRRRTTPQRVEYPSATHPCPSSLNPPIAAILSAL
ncbi:hypothetical protein [Streptomyces sp. NPDC005548]|uniref:hypothetical protein n=1 Tax=Streptomyces sp. NPDC005548 TaxID=3364724 RepID=UPI00367FA699